MKLHNPHLLPQNQDSATIDLIFKSNNNPTPYGLTFFLTNQNTYTVTEFPIDLFYFTPDTLCIFIASTYWMHNNDPSYIGSTLYVDKIYLTSEPVTVAIRNFGCSAVSNIPVTFTYNGPQSGTLTEIVPGPIAPGATLMYTFSSTVDLSSLGTYQLTAYTSLTTDLNHINDTTSFSLLIDVPRITSLPYQEDFNINDGYWVTGGTNNSWQYGVFTDMGGDGGYGASWSTSLTGNYNNSENSWILSPIFDLSVYADPIVSFDIKYSTESCCDKIYFEMSTDGGQTFSTLSTLAGSSSNTWVHFSDTIFMNTCNNTCVRFRFRLQTDGSVVYPGVAIDNFELLPNARINMVEVVDLHFNNSCTPTASENIGISVRNIGHNVLCNVPVYCRITHPTQPTQLLSTIVPGPISPWQRVNVVFPTTADLSQYMVGQYTLTGWVDLPSDLDHSNDTIVRFNPDTISSYPYLVTFDTWHENWVSNGNLTNSWEINDFTKMGGNVGFGRSWITNYLGNYNNGEQSWVMSPILDFSTLSCPFLEFDIKYNTEYCCDWGQVQYSLDGGASWAILGSSSDPNWYNSTTSWKGSSSSNWVHVTHALTPLANNSCVLLRFLFRTDGSVTGDGFALDNIHIFNNDPDVSPVALLQPIANKEYCDRRLSDTVVIRFFNYGCSALTNIPFNFIYSGPHGGSFSEVVPGPIPPGGYVDYTCANTVDMSAAGVYQFNIVTQYPGDAYVANDTLQVTLNQVFYQPQVISSYPYLEDFNASDGGWILHPSSINATFQWGTFTDMGGPAGYGNCWATNLTGNYNNNENDYLYTTIFDMSSLTSPVIEFDLKMVTESCCDWLALEYSINGGATWTTMQTWQGNLSSSWNHIRLFACNLAGSSCVLFRFVFHSDGSVVYTGPAIDNFQISDEENDVGVIAVLEPITTNDFCQRRDSVPITLRIKNFSCQPVSNVPVSFVITGPISATYTEIVPGPINPNSTIDYTFSGTVNLTQVGTYQVIAYTDMPGELYRANDTVKSTVTVSAYLPIVQTFPYSEDFNSGPADWQVLGNSSISLGTFSKLGGNVGYGLSWMTNLNGPYNNNEDGYLISPIFDLSTLSCAWISFDYKFNTESCCDYATFEYSTNGGATWNILGAAGDFENWFNNGSSWRGNGGTNWIHAQHDISFLAGQSCVIFRLRFHSDGSVVSDGFAFDNFNLHNTPIDAAITGMSGCYGASYPLEIFVRNNNNGNDRFCNPLEHINSITVTTVINGGAPFTQTITGLDIAPNTTAIVTVPGVFIPDNSSTIFVQISLPNGNTDYVTYNDTLTVQTNQWPMCNDHCAYATQLYQGTTLASQTSFATIDPSEDPAFSGCQPLTLENTVWYFFQTDESGGNVNIDITNTTCSPSTQGIQVDIIQASGDPCDQSDNIELACFNYGDTSSIHYELVDLPPNTTFLIVIDGYANNNCSFNITLTGAVPLPVEWLTFDAKLVNNQALLQWTTATETNNDYFVVQRMPDGGGSFETIAIVDGAGTTNQPQTYKAIDLEPFVGITYYRIKQVDFNGNYSYSDIRYVNNMLEPQSLIYPNPIKVGNILNICLTYEKTSSFVLKLFSSDDKLVDEKIVSFDKHCAQYQIPLSLKTGLYHLLIQLDNGKLLPFDLQVVND